LTTHRALTPTRPLLNKVPEITLYFWVIKVLCTTVGESAADYLNVNLGLGLSGTSLITGVLLVVALIFQFAADRYVSGRYWLAVTLVSVFGTLVTDNLTDNVGLPLEASTLIFGGLLAVTFTAWYTAEKTLSIHSIRTRGREAFYWTTILFTFALGTASGDLMAEVLGLGYLVTGIIVASLITIIGIGWRLGLHSVLAFWIIYVLTRPLGASIGDYLSQPQSQGGLGLGATTTSLVFLVAILGLVIYLALTKVDVIGGGADRSADEAPERGGRWQTVVVVGLLLVAGGAGYAWRTSTLQADTSSDVAPIAQNAHGASSPAPRSPLGDLSTFRVITQDTLRLLDSGDQAGATARVDDLEIGWDNAEARLRPKDRNAWTTADSKIDKVLRELRATSPNPDTEKAALTALLAALG
jgi:uncharacterized membrane-anchored protein